MTDAVIVSTARTGLAKSWKGAFNMTHGATLGGHVIAEAVKRAGLDGGAVEDVILGCANPEGATGFNIARQAGIRAGLPVSAAGMTINRFCSSGLQAIATAGNAIRNGESDVLVAGGVESISCVQNEMNTHMLEEGWLRENKPEIYWNMVQTAEQVAKRYGIDRDRMDEYGLSSQLKAAAAAEAGKFDGEIVPITVPMAKADMKNGIFTREVTVTADEGIRPDSTLKGIKGIRTVFPGGSIAAGNASQFSDGASACVLMSDKKAAEIGATPMGIYRGFAVAGCEPDEMGIGPCLCRPEAAQEGGPDRR